MPNGCKILEVGNKPHPATVDSKKTFSAYESQGLVFVVFIVYALCKMMKTPRYWQKTMKLLVAICFMVTGLNLPYVQAQEFVLPKPGAMVQLSPEFTPAQLTGIIIHPTDALKFDFIIHKGDQVLSVQDKELEYSKLIKYFLASLAVPDNDQWVNLSPYEKNRLINEDFGKTEMGRDLLAQDYMLKQVTASLIYPQDKLGKEFWNEVYLKAYKQFGTTNIPVNTFNKVWIIPDDAEVFEKGNMAYVTKNHLKVMLEQDYLALEKNTVMASEAKQSVIPANEGIQNKNDINSISSQIVREIVLPALEKEINEGKNFAPLRQVFSGVVLAAWYKRALKESFLGKAYMNKALLKGVDQDPKNNQVIYQQYLKAFKQGVFNFIKEDVDKYSNEPIPRKYFSGGITVARFTDKNLHISPPSAAQLANAAMNSSQEDVVTVRVDMVDAAMHAGSKADNEKGLVLVGDLNEGVSSARKLLRAIAKGSQLKEELESILRSPNQRDKLEVLLGLMDVSPDMARAVLNWALILRKKNPKIAAITFGNDKSKFVSRVIEKIAAMKDEQSFPILLQLATERPEVFTGDEWLRHQDETIVAWEVFNTAIKSLAFFPAHEVEIRSALEPMIIRGINEVSREVAIETLGKLGAVTEATEALWRTEINGNAPEEGHDLRIAVLNIELLKVQRDEGKIDQDTSDLFESLVMPIGSAAGGHVYDRIVELLDLGLDRSLVYSYIVSLLDREDVVKQIYRDGSERASTTRTRSAYLGREFPSRLRVLMKLYELEKDPARLDEMNRRIDLLRQEVLEILRQEPTREPGSTGVYYQLMDILTVLKVDDAEAVDVVIDFIEREIDHYRNVGAAGESLVVPFLRFTVPLLGIMSKKHPEAMTELFNLLDFSTEVGYGDLGAACIETIGEISAGDIQVAKRIAPWAQSPGKGYFEAAKVVIDAFVTELKGGKPLALAESSAIQVASEVRAQETVRPMPVEPVGVAGEFVRAGNTLADLYSTPPMSVGGLRTNDFAKGDPIIKLDALVERIAGSIKVNDDQFRVSELPSMFGISAGAARFVAKKIAEDKANIQVDDLPPSDQLLSRRKDSFYATSMILRGIDTIWTEIPDDLIRGSLDIINNTERNQFADMSEDVWLEENGFRRRAGNSYISRDGYLTVTIDPVLGVQSINAADFSQPIYFKEKTTLLRYNHESGTTTLMTGRKVVQYYGHRAMFGDGPGTLRGESEEFLKGKVQELNDESVQRLIQTNLVTARELIDKVKIGHVVGEVYVMDIAKLAETELEELIDMNIEKGFYGVRFKDKNYLFVVLGEEKSVPILKIKHTFFQAHDHPGDGEIFPSIPDIMNTARSLPGVPTFIIDRKNKRLMQYSQRKPIPFNGMLMVTEGVGGGSRYFVNTNDGYPKYIFRYPTAVPVMDEFGLSLDVGVIKAFSNVSLFDQRSFRLLFPAGVVLNYRKENSLRKIFIETNMSGVDAVFSPDVPVEVARSESQQRDGGIDVNAAYLNLHIKRDGNGVPLPLTQQDKAQLNNLAGLKAVILKIQPAAESPLLTQVLK